MKVGDKVRVTAHPKEIGVVSQIVRGTGPQAVLMVKLNRNHDGVTHVIVAAHELELA